MSISIRRAKSPMAVSWVKDRLLDTGDLSKEQVCSMLESMLRENSPNLLLIVAVNDETNKVVGHAIVTAPENAHYTFIYEAEYDTKLRLEQAVELMTKAKEAVVKWTIFLGRSGFRMETSRNPLTWARKWGMKEVSVVMEYRLDSEMPEQIFEEISERKEKKNGRRNDDKDRVDERPEATDQDHRGHADGPGRERSEARPGIRDVRTGSDSVSGAVGGGSPQGVRADSVEGAGSGPFRSPEEYHERYLASVERAKGDGLQESPSSDPVTDGADPAA